MIARSLLFAAALTSQAAFGVGQGVPPIDHIVVNDPRIFDLSNDGAAYNLADGTITSATLSIVQGPKGKLTGTATVTNIYGESFGPLAMSGRVEVTGLGPLVLSMKGGAPGQIKFSVTGTYDTGPKLMNVVAVMKIKDNTFQWNDSFSPHHAGNTGLALHKLSLGTNSDGVIKGTFAMQLPGTPGYEVPAIDRQKLPTTDFSFKTGSSLINGTFTNPDNVFVVLSADMNCGYGRIVTPGSSVAITTDNGFLRDL